MTATIVKVTLVRTTEIGMVMAMEMGREIAMEIGMEMAMERMQGIMGDTRLQKC